MAKIYMSASRFAALFDMYKNPVPSITLSGRRRKTFDILVEGKRAHVVSSNRGPLYALTDVGLAEYTAIYNMRVRPNYTEGHSLYLKPEPKPEPVTTNPEIEALQARLAALEAENARLKGEKLANRTDIMFKLSGKGAISVLRLGRWPVTLYWNQWERLLERVDDLRKFAEQNKDKLATK